MNTGVVSGNPRISFLTFYNSYHFSFYLEINICCYFNHGQHFIQIHIPFDHAPELVVFQFRILVEHLEIIPTLLD